MPESLDDIEAVCALLGGSRPLNRSTIYRLIRRGLLPKPLKLGGSSRWVRSEIEAALAALAVRR
jgi:predicted DNA-binding transcriptional regulator AlpA